MTQFAKYRRLVDVVVGGQWGSEGKGNIAAFLAPEYPNLMRVGGPNAGHYTLDDDGGSYCHRQLPSGSRRIGVNGFKPNLLIGPGATLRESLLLQEIEDCDAYGRLLVHPQAAMISDLDVMREGELVKAIGSTGQGVGQCAARRILRDGTTSMARDTRSLDSFVDDTTFQLEQLFALGQRVLLEGTQGTGLSLYHGSYPHVTSRDTTVAGTCAEAGIAPARVNRVYMVLRTNPIRVNGTSGPMGEEIDWSQVAVRAGRDADELAEQEKGSVSLKTRRVAEFDFDQAREAAHLNGATDIALTFADYLHPDNAQARSFEDLTDETRAFVHKIEDEIGVHVSLISVGFFPGCVIDRRIPSVATA